VLTGGEDPQKVRAAGEFEWLVHRRLLLRRRLVELDRRIAEHHTLFSWARQMWFDLMLQFESWIAHG
jgi:hypothetical protein